MAEDQDKKDEDKIEFTPEGETLGYIGMDQALVRAMQVATETPGDYGTAYTGVRMAFQVFGAEETDDHYVITLSLRPQGDFSGRPGQEQFFIEKDGVIAHRQVLALPRPERRFPVIPIAIGVAVTGVVAVIAVLAVGGSGRGDDNQTGAQAPLPAPTEAPVVSPLSEATPTSVPSARLEVPVTRVVAKEVPVTVEVPVTRVVVKEVPVTVVVVATPTSQPAGRSAGRGGTGPDLVIEDVTSQPANPAVGDKVTWDVRVRNQGLGNANGFRIAPKTSSNADCSNYYDKKANAVRVDLDFLGVGQAETVRLTLTVKAGTSYWLVVDSCGKVQETDEGNNAFRIQLSMADLVIEKVTSAPTNPAVGDKVTWDVRVRNQGLGNANGFRIAPKSGPIADCSNYYDKGANAVRVDLDFLGAGQVETVRLTLTVKAGTSYWLVVDSCGKVQETDETNNAFQFGQVR